jgi:UDP-2,3-diacylglucosamine hydrolase
VAARWYRWRSYWHKRKKSLEIMDVNQETVSQVMKKHGCLQLIHGHTHRPNVHDFQIDGNAARRFVLAAWNKEAGQTLCWTSQGYRIETV